MEKQLECRVLRLEDKNQVLGFISSMSKGDESLEGPSFLQWTSSFREESLDFYLSQNWCFGCFSENKLEGVILLQPFLFWNGLTQILWVEGLEANDTVIEDLLVDTSYRTAREKHLQALAFSTVQPWDILLDRLGLKKEMSEHGPIVKTARWV